MEKLVHTADGSLQVKEERVQHDGRSAVFLRDHPWSKPHCYIKYDDARYNHHVGDIKVDFRCACVRKDDVKFL